MGFIVTPSAPAGTDYQWTFIESNDFAVNVTFTTQDLSSYDEVLIDIDISGAGTNLELTFDAVTSGYEANYRAGSGSQSNTTGASYIHFGSDAVATFGGLTGYFLVSKNANSSTVFNVSCASNLNTNYLINGTLNGTVYTTITLDLQALDHTGKANVYGRVRL